MITSNSPWYKIMIYGLEKLGLYYSCYRGFVVDNVDPKGLNRIKIISPVLGPFNTPGLWAYPKGQWGGKNYGVNLLPKIGDLIWLEFEHGKLDYPIWSLASFGKDEKPSEFDTPYKYGFKTPAGSIIIIDDTGGEESILVKHNNQEEYIKLIKEKTILEAKEIYLGEDGEEKAAMGETLQSKLEELHDAVSDLATQVSTLATGVVSVFPGAPAVATAATIISTTVTTLKSTLSQILSNKVRLDKD